jgi:hypothetical protein
LLQLRAISNAIPQCHANAAPQGLSRATHQLPLLIEIVFL